METENAMRDSGIGDDDRTRKDRSAGRQSLIAEYVDVTGALALFRLTFGNSGVDRQLFETHLS